jgi:hypothetical protein
MDKFTEAEVKEIIAFSEKFPTVVNGSLLKQIYSVNCASGNVDIVKIFLEKKVIKTPCNYYEGFHKAITKGQKTVIKLFLDDKETSPFHLCCACQGPIYACLNNKQDEILELILNDGREHHTNIDGMFKWCIEWGNSIDCTKVLIKKTKDIDFIKMTTTAVSRDNLELIKFLVEDGRFDFSSHLKKFVIKNKIETVKVLLSKHYSYDIINDCLNEACSKKYKDIAELLFEMIDIDDVVNDDTKKYLKEHILKPVELAEKMEKFKDILNSMNSLYGEITALQQ